MPIDSPEKYAIAAAKLEDPELRPELRSALRVQMASFRAQNPQGISARATPGFGPHEEGFDATMARAGGPSGPEANPGIAKAINANPIPGAPGVHVAESDEELDAREESLARQEEIRKQNEKLPNASKDPNVPPPEYTAADKPGGPTLADAFPRLLGGKVSMWNEPTVGQFHREMAPALLVMAGKNPAHYANTPVDLHEFLNRNYGEDSPEFKRYADIKWTEAYEQAKAAQTPIVRVAYANDAGGDYGVRKFGSDFLESIPGKPLSPTLPGGDVSAPGRVANALMGGLVSAGAGVANGFFPGSADAISALGGPEAVQVTRGEEESHPVLNFAGGMLGAAKPGSLMSRVTGRASGALGGPLGGAVGGGVQQGLQSAASQAVDLTMGTRKKVDAKDVGHAAAEGAALGFGLGMLGEGIGGLAEGSASKLREGPNGAALRRVEDIGGKTSATEGIQLPGSVLENENAAARAGTGAPVDYAVRKVQEPIARQAHEQDATTMARIETETAAAHSALGDQKVTAAPFAKKALEILKSLRSLDTGGELPFARSKPFMEALSRSVKVEVLEDGRNAPTDATVLPLDEAQADGVTALVPTGQIQRAQQAAPGKNFRIMVRPIELTAPELDRVNRLVDQAADLTNPKGEPDPDLIQLSAALKESRDQFVLGNERGGYSKLKGRHADEQSALERGNREAGLPAKRPRPYGELTADQAREFDSNLRGFGTGEGRLANDERLLSLAKDAGVERQLKEIAGTRLGLQLRDHASAGNGPGVVISESPHVFWSGIAKFLRYRKDPAMRAIGSTPTVSDLGPLGELLASMRAEQPAAPWLTANQAFGLRGGQAAARVSGALTPEDIDNLARLVTLYSGKKGDDELQTDVHR